ncbi:sulfatase [Bacteroidia bacterium]|nr:sulfatase [Bacteroidia bacterium]
MNNNILQACALSAIAVAGALPATGAQKTSKQEQRQGKRPNVLFIMADQWRAQATGYNGDPNARTPNLDAFARESIDFSCAVTSQPLSSPYRASLITGQFTTTNGMMQNDEDLKPNAPTAGELFTGGGYTTGYIGKWHLFGGGRQNFIPAEKRFGFERWRVMNCTHDYNKSFYWGEKPVKMQWDGYDAFAQTAEMMSFLEQAAGDDRPFCMFLSWGPPHAPYNTAPAEYQAMYSDPSKIVLRPNVPAEKANSYRKQLAGYYAHIAALDKAFGDLVAKLRNLGILDNTIVVFTADHGDMLGSHDFSAKSRPYDESIRIPLLMRYPPFGAGRKISEPLTTPDILPTLLSMCNIAVPQQIQGRSFLPILADRAKSLGDCALVQWPLCTDKLDLKEYRCLRTRQYTYVETLKGPWLLFDDTADPYQDNNLAENPKYASLRKELATKMHAEMERVGDKFLTDAQYRTQFGLAPQKKPKSGGEGSE